jgi:hypothetical protein
VQDEKLFFNEFDEFFGKFGDSSVLAFAELVAQAKSVNGRNGLAEGIKVTQKVHEPDGHAPTGMSANMTGLDRRWR